MKHSLIALLSLFICLPSLAGTHVLLNTNMGNIEIDLADQQAPVTVANFLSYVNAGQYNGEIFHRVIPGFVAQGGGYTESLQLKPTNAAIINESNNGLKNVRGSIAMARTSDPNSATAQFYINLVDNPSLDYSASTGPGYAVFGTVVNGMSVVDAMATVPTVAYGVFDSLPETPILINTASQVTPFSAAATASGPLTKQTLQATLSVATTDAGQSGAVFVVAVLPNRSIYLLTPNGWLPFSASSPAVYSLGVLQNTTINIITATDLSALVGTTLYVGYGVGNTPSTSLADLVSKDRLTAVYTIH